MTLLLLLCREQLAGELLCHSMFRMARKVRLPTVDATGCFVAAFGSVWHLCAGGIPGGQWRLAPTAPSDS
jgi:hypothetical protein